MKMILLAAPASAALARRVGERLDAEPGACTVRGFPDGECYVRIDTPLSGRMAAIACSLDRPQEKILPLLFLAATARDIGAASVGLIAPYLPYMRQDARFRSGEGVTSMYFASLLSKAFDWLVTVDPHLHRWQSLEEIYSIPARAARTAPAIAAWIRTHVENPVLIGPDEESAQWVCAVADLADVPYTILDKVRLGDREVESSVPDLLACRGHTPVIIDDIIATGHTMIRPVEYLVRAGLPAPICIGVHAVFAGGACADLRAAGADTVVTCNTIAHETNAIAVDDVLTACVRDVIS